MTSSFFDMQCCVLIWLVTAASVTVTCCQWSTALRANNWIYQQWTLNNIVIYNPFCGMQIMSFLFLTLADHIYCYRVMVTYNRGVYWQLNSVVYMGWTSSIVPFHTCCAVQCSSDFSLHGFWQLCALRDSLVQQRTTAPTAERLRPLPSPAWAPSAWCAQGLQAR